MLMHADPTLGSRGYFFLIDTDGSWQRRGNEALMRLCREPSVSLRKKYPLEPRVYRPLSQRQILIVCQWVCHFEDEMTRDRSPRVKIVWLETGY